MVGFEFIMLEPYEQQTTETYVKEKGTLYEEVKSEGMLEALANSSLTRWKSDE